MFLKTLDPKIKDAFASVSTEAFFAVLPLFILPLVLRHSSIWHILGSPEWSFGAAVLSGQALVKFVSGMTRGQSRNTDRVGLAVAALFVFAVAPCLAVLGEILKDEKHVDHPLIVIQMGLFAASLVIFFFFGTIGHMWQRSQ
jgi:hypothetical protein